jgi:predicted dehydrogenase/threonine dehydrogenase-like Zn-dependent dehydrogenase
MKQVVVQGGSARVIEAAAPIAGTKNILVQVSRSCISAGTELAGVRMSGLPLYQRALKQPDNVRQVVNLMRDQGVMRTLRRVKGKLAAGTPTGYSAAGRVIGVGGEADTFQVGDIVACAGAGIANHAEYIDVPVNLAVHVPDTVGFDAASTVTLGAIALQGLRRANPTLGETFVVVGLGVLGQLTVQMLKANGCRAIGIDVDEKRVDLARANGLNIGILASAEDVVDRVHKHTNGLGADGTIITAGSSSHQLISDAMKMCRKKGRVVLVGDVGLNLNRADFYAKELDFLISASYGPGRYDPVYEEGGQDYPLPYVRWTENRNMQAYLAMLADGSIKLDNLIRPAFPIVEAERAYASFDEEDKPLIALLSYPETDGEPVRRIDTGLAAAKDGRVRVGIVGASSFAQAVLIPNMHELKADYTLHAVMSRTGSNAKMVADQQGAVYSSTQESEILADPDVDLVMVASRHDLHGASVLAALEAGKHVFVEKPLTLDPADLERIADFYARNPTGPVLMVGYNRRFSPAIAAVRRAFATRSSPMIVNYRMNAGYIPRDHWVHGPEGGGRNLGEACHIYDLFNALVGNCDVVDVSARPIGSSDPQWGANDNFVTIIAYRDGSVCTLTYTALGAKAYPKERCEIFCDGKVASLDDYKSVEFSGASAKGWRSSSADKGHNAELQSLARSLRGKAEGWPIALDDLLTTSRTAFAVEEQIRQFDRS